MSACVYLRLTVPGVPSNPIVRVTLAAAAGLIARTVPTTGIATAARTAGRATVLAVLQAMTTTSGARRRASAGSTVSTRAMSAASAFVPNGK